MSADLVHALRETLRGHDLQVTAQRLAVLRAVAVHPHGTANDIADEVRREIGAISRQSVYDTLTLLTERDVLRRIQLAGSAARYEERLDDDHHHHVVCRRCDRLVDVECAAGEVPCLAPEETAGFVVDEVEVLFRGLCPDCRTPRPEAKTAHTEEKS